MMHATAPMLQDNILSKPWYRHLWPWLLMVGPFIAVVAGLLASWLAFNNQDALVVGDYYKQGQAINQDLRRDQAAANLKMTAALGYDAVTDQLYGVIKSAGKPYNGKVLISLIHSTQPAKDMHFSVQLDKQGRFSAPLPMLEIAHWQILVENGQRSWRLNGSWPWPQQKSVNINAN